MLFVSNLSFLHKLYYNLCYFFILFYMQLNIYYILDNKVANESNIFAINLENYIVQLYCNDYLNK